MFLKPRQRIVPTSFLRPLKKECLEIEKGGETQSVWHPTMNLVFVFYELIIVWVIIKTKGGQVIHFKQKPKKLTIWGKSRRYFYLLSPVTCLERTCTFDHKDIY